MGPAQGVNLVVVGARREVFEYAQELVVPKGADEFDVADFGLRAHL